MFKMVYLYLLNKSFNDLLWKRTSIINLPVRQTAKVFMIGGYPPSGR